MEMAQGSLREERQVAVEPHGGGGTQAQKQTLLSRGSYFRQCRVAGTEQFDPKEAQVRTYIIHLMCTMSFGQAAAIPMLLCETSHCSGIILLRQACAAPLISTFHIQRPAWPAVSVFVVMGDWLRGTVRLFWELLMLMARESSNTYTWIFKGQAQVHCPQPRQIKNRQRSPSRL